MVSLPYVVTELFFHLYYGRYSHVHLLRAFRTHGEKFIERKNAYIKEGKLNVQKLKRTLASEMM